MKSRLSFSMYVAWHLAHTQRSSVSTNAGPEPASRHREAGRSRFDQAVPCADRFHGIRGREPRRSPAERPVQDECGTLPPVPVEVGVALTSSEQACVSCVFRNERSAAIAGHPSRDHLALASVDVADDSAPEPTRCVEPPQALCRRDSLDAKSRKVGEPNDHYRSSRLRILPVGPLGSAATNSTMRGYL